jgi:hypothetical protein
VRARERSQRWYEANRERKLESVRRWREANPDKVRDLNARRIWIGGEYVGSL